MEVLVRAQDNKHQVCDFLAQDIASAFFAYAGLVWHMGLDEEITGVPDESAGPPEAYDRHARTRGMEVRRRRSADAR